MDTSTAIYRVFEKARELQRAVTTPHETNQVKDTSEHQAPSLPASGAGQANTHRRPGRTETTVPQEPPNSD